MQAGNPQKRSEGTTSRTEPAHSDVVDVIEMRADVRDNSLCVAPGPARRYTCVTKVANLIMRNDCVRGVLRQNATAFLIEMPAVCQNIVDHHVASNAGLGNAPLF